MEPDLSGAELSEVDLRGENLLRTGLLQANLSEADLTGVTFLLAELDDAQLDGCRVNGLRGILRGTRVKLVPLSVIL